ncbi:hypothetical protein [Sulfurimonas sp.]|uniref:hypothetical protein n=1 Tax=Sulfurimonas sp. TaxID=2022749 RepID=UPI002B49432A|nr:hypothetical protein [Sulfurimonas sp.]
MAALGAGLGGGWAAKGPIPILLSKMPQPFPIIGAIVGGTKVGIGETVGASIGK